MKKIVFATGNPTKAKRFSKGLSEYDIEVLSLKDLNLDLDVEEDGNIHNLNYKDEKEPMNTVDIVLTIVLIIVILIVIYYIIYIMLLQAAYPTFMDALYGLSNPQNVINNLLSPPQWNIFIVYLFFKFI